MREERRGKKVTKDDGQRPHKRNKRGGEAEVSCNSENESPE